MTNNIYEKSLRCVKTVIKKIWLNRSSNSFIYSFVSIDIKEPRNDPETCTWRETHWRTTNRSLPPLEYKRIIRSSVCLTFIGYRRCTKIHINRFIAGSSKCSTNPLSILLTKLLTHIKQGPQKYHVTAYSRSGINRMWILKNSKELLDHLKSPNFNLITNIKSFNFSTLIFASQGFDRLPSVPLAGFRQVFKLSANMRLTSPA